MTAHRPDLGSVFLIHSRTKPNPRETQFEAFPAIMGKCNHHSCGMACRTGATNRDGWSEKEVRKRKGEIREMGIQEIQLERLDPTTPEAS